MPTDSDRILAAGIPFTLIDGREVRLRYTMRSLKMLEDEFDSLTKVETVLSGDEDSKKIGPLMSVLAAGLIHENLSAESLLDLTNPSQLQDYADLIGKAFNEAFPESSGKAEEVPVSPGVTGTSSPPSPVGELTKVSG